MVWIRFKNIQYLVTGQYAWAEGRNKVNERYSCAAHVKLKVTFIVAFVAIIQVLKFCVTDVKHVH
jgi:hypothetical protein